MQLGKLYHKFQISPFYETYSNPNIGLFKIDGTLTCTSKLTIRKLRIPGEGQTYDGRSP